jgi:hypothetical protein
MWLNIEGESGHEAVTALHDDSLNYWLWLGNIA